jgi:hypothetical protein
VLSLQVTSGGSSSRCAPVGPSSAWWNDQRNDRHCISSCPVHPFGVTTASPGGCGVGRPTRPGGFHDARTSSHQQSPPIGLDPGVRARRRRRGARGGRPPRRRPRANHRAGNSGPAADRAGRDGPGRAQGRSSVRHASCGGPIPWSTPWWTSTNRTARPVVRQTPWNQSASCIAAEPAAQSPESAAAWPTTWCRPDPHKGHLRGLEPARRRRDRALSAAVDHRPQRT